LGKTALGVGTEQILTLFISSRQLLKLERAVERNAEIPHVLRLSNDTLLTEDVVYPVNLRMKQTTNKAIVDSRLGPVPRSDELNQTL